jgi:Heterokaryon incompatibility protein (HET)
MSWTDQNELVRLGKKMLEVTGTNTSTSTSTNTNTPSEKSIISQLASYTGVGYNAARDAYVKGVLDPLLQEKVRKSMNWLINANYIPEFVHGETLNADLDDSAEVSAIKPDGIESPKRMFNIDTGMLEDWPSGQYAILSHSWKGQEITYSFISKIKASQKKREVYEMLQEEDDEEAVRFGRFQSKKFKHLEAGMTDIALLGAQCIKDCQDASRKIDALLSRSGIKSSPRELLEKLAKFKIASSEAKEASDSYNEKEDEVKQRKMSAKAPEEKKDVGVVSEKPSATDEKGDSSKKLTPAEELVKAESELAEAQVKRDTTEEQRDKAKESCGVMNQIPALKSAVEDLLLALERKKSMNKIEGSMEEARRILDLNLFPRKGRNRYLWNDTCCINKADANELNESLAMMGQWYNNADFCLVHLDTKESTEWVHTWDHLEKKADNPNWRTFAEIEKPNWATRGWTLQELVLSKMTFYVNSLWQPLSRGAEGLGPYYYHCSYLAHHIREENISDAPPHAKSTLQDLAKLQNLMDTLTEEKVEVVCYRNQCSFITYLAGGP